MKPSISNPGARLNSVTLKFTVDELFQLNLSVNHYAQGNRSEFIRAAIEHYTDFLDFSLPPVHKKCNDRNGDSR